ncbi:MAG: hypothetical protein JWN04_4704 [Myxococcaceae bacterium]|nr:hypothetical protein [Myxococcaceae bacterium]
MKQLLTVLALASFAVACGDDSGDSPTVTKDGGIDSGAHDAGGADSSVGPKVVNVGAMCGQTSECTGSAATCDLHTALGQVNQGGYCSASCLQNDECGPNGDCPIGEVIRAIGPTMGQTAGTCFAKCTPGATSVCRSGYVCSDLLTVLTAAGVPNLPNATVAATAAPSLLRNVCLPIPQALDGGVQPHDAGSVADASGIDSGR